MALCAVRFPVVLIQKLSRNAVIERRGTPLAVACLAFPARADVGHTLVTVPATLAFVEPLQWPAGTGMVKRLGFRLAILPMATPAPAGLPARQIHVTLVAADAPFMVLCERAGLFLNPLPCVAACAASLVVTLHASKTETVGVLPMAEDHLGLRNRQGLAVDIRIGLRDRTVHYAQDVILDWSDNRLRAGLPAGLLTMTDVAVPFVDPLTVAVHTLLMVSASQGGLVNIGLRVRHRMTRSASGVLLPFGCMMVADDAALCHLGHVGVALVVERHG